MTPTCCQQSGMLKQEVGWYYDLIVLRSAVPDERVISTNTSMLLTTVAWARQVTAPPPSSGHLMNSSTTPRCRHEILQNYLACAETLRPRSLIPRMKSGSSVMNDADSSMEASSMSVTLPARASSASFAVAQLFLPRTGHHCQASRHHGDGSVNSTCADVL